MNAAISESGVVACSPEHMDTPGPWQPLPLELAAHWQRQLEAELVSIARPEDYEVLGLDLYLDRQTAVACDRCGLRLDNMRKEAA